MDQLGRRKGQVINQSNGVDAIIYDRPDYVFWYACRFTSWIYYHRIQIVHEQIKPAPVEFRPKCQQENDPYLDTPSALWCFKAQ